MSVIADISPFVADDRLAKRNALVLAVAQALAGGNNTVIAATAGIVGTMLASDAGLATLPVSVMVCGIWLGTLPQGYLARNFGRRFALQFGSVIAFAIITETVFQWPGMGLLFVQAVQNVDIPIMAAYLLMVSLIFVTINLVVDILYTIVDPRLRSTISRPA